MWIVVLFAYGIFLAVATFVLAYRNTEREPAFFAAARLPFNHLIVERDLRDASWWAPSRSPGAAQNKTSSSADNPAPSTGANGAPALDGTTKSPPSTTNPAKASTATGKQQPVALPAQDAKTTARFVGKYTSGTVGQRQLLREWELGPTPSLSPPDGVLRLLLPVSVGDITSGKINAGLLLCVGRPTPVKVVAVICAPGIAAPCNAIIDLPADAANLSNDIIGGKKIPVPPSADNKCS